MRILGLAGGILKRREGTVKRSVVIAFASVIAVVLLLVLPFAAGAGSDKRFVLSWRGSFTGANSGAGTFSVGGGLDDSGSFAATFTVQPTKDNCEVVLADETFTTASGSFSAHVDGLSCGSSANTPRETFDGHFEITGGTGAYAGLSGTGTVTSLADFAANEFTGVHVGNAHFAH